MSGLNPAALAALAKLCERSGGTLRPLDVIEEGRPADSPLHSQFTWDNEQAGDELRLIQARALIARVKVTLVTGPETVVTVRAYHSLPSDRGGAGYRPLGGCISDAARKRELLQTALRELAGFRRRYRDLTELDGVMLAIGDTLESEPAAAVG
jgi:hypothetical protein